MWTPEREQIVKVMWGQGCSASVIGRQLGVSRNAVIGKLHRMNAPPRPRTRKPPQAYRKRKKQGGDMRFRPRPVLPPVPEYVAPQAPTSLRVPLMALNDSMCKWPHGDPQDSDFHFCGHKTPDGQSYCAFHYRVAYSARQGHEAA